MNPYIIADTHLGHAKLSDDLLRPKGFSEKIIRHLEDVLNRDSVLIHLGDVSFTEDENWNIRLTELPGKKYLILGNHDSRSMNWYLSKNWDAVFESMSFTLFGKRILFSHMPQVAEGYDINIHAHFHEFGLEKVRELEPELYAILNKKHFLVSMEENKYIPIRLNRIIEIFNTGKDYGLRSTINP
jgi:calcineurin-like phosphoesterase family protein